MKSTGKRATLTKNNNPYRESGNIIVNGNQQNGNLSFSTVPTGTERSRTSLDGSGRSIHSSLEGLPPTIGAKSVAPTMSTSISGPAHSEAAASHDAPSSGETTNGTAGYGVSGRGNDSAFSSPAPSVRSLTTTLTTIQSAAPAVGSVNNATGHANSIHFSHQFPTSPPPNALPAHMAPQGSGGHPATYTTATANNLLTDNASILTLASSSHRRRRRSMDTDASVRALAPSSLFGGSRESLPLSVLSANIDSSSIITPHRERSERVNVPRMDERASIYSVTGVAPALSSERNSYYAGKAAGAGDGASVNSGFLGHGRNDSVSGSIGGLAAVPSSPLTTGMREAPGRLSRTNSDWVAEVEGETDDKDTEDKEDKDGCEEEHKENGKV